MRNLKKHQLSILVNLVGLFLLFLILMYDKSLVVLGLVGSSIFWMISGFLQMSTPRNGMN